MSEIEEPTQQLEELTIEEKVESNGNVETTVTTTSTTTAPSGRKQETEEERAERLKKQEEIDSRSVYVGNVDFKSTPEQLESFFSTVGATERITILFDRFSGLPKGYAYIEFSTVDSAQKAIAELHGKEFRGRELRVTTKRTNLPRMSSKSRGRGGFRGRGRGGRGSFRGRGRGGFRGGRGGKAGSNSTSEHPEVSTKSAPENPAPEAVAAAASALSSAASAE